MRFVLVLYFKFLRFKFHRWLTVGVATFAIQFHKTTQTSEKGGEWRKLEFGKEGIYLLNFQACMKLFPGTEVLKKSSF
jgi:hypothetical protein